jgi:hypothetical protein
MALHGNAATKAYSDICIHMYINTTLCSCTIHTYVRYQTVRHLVNVILTQLQFKVSPMAQSRQSAKLFHQSLELGLPQPLTSLTRRRVCPPPHHPLWFRGEGHTRWRERGWESPNSNEETYLLRTNATVRL